MKCGIDVDDVLAEYVDGLRDYYNHVHFDRVQLGQIQDYDLSAFKKIPSPEARKFCGAR